ncbi:hypothetical protein PWG15_09755 [Ensifer adhaerens]|uniref:hypothetical protein n=1 Tax=Ensifer adhaerens TaxID=106592 RepID=UPI0023A95864|nr:hypothetical protein [Ensifer adhaerens]WDZ78747.1 hypothetical protein PWG15_09755 [Ensifer adhaerens]
MALSLNDVYSVQKTREDGVLLVKCNITDLEDAVYDCDYVSRPEDGFGLNPAIRKWLTDNSDFPFVDYVPPTDEESRQVMPSLSARQFRLGLVGAGVSPEAVATTIAAMPLGAERDRAQIEWEYGDTFHRIHPLVATIAIGFGLSDLQVDALWLAAVNL